MGRIKWEPRDEGRLLGTLGGIEVFWIRPKPTALYLDFTWTGQSWSVGGGKAIVAAKQAAEKTLEAFAHTTGMTLPPDESEPNILTEQLLDAVRRVLSTNAANVAQTLALEALDIFRAKVQEVMDANEHQFDDIEYTAVPGILLALLDDIKLATEELK